jgi:uncharacterized protein
LKTAFADTSFWIALLNPKDDLHGRAAAIAASLDAASIVTSEMVLTELLNDFAGRGPMLRAAAKELVEQLGRNPRTIIIPQTDAQFHAALALYADRGDKTWSLTDCASFLIMKAHGTTCALTYDRHFEQMGFAAMLRESPAGED